MMHAVLAAASPAPALSWPGSFNLPSWTGPALASAGIVLGLVIIINQIRTDRRRARAATTPPSPARASTRQAEPGHAREVMRDAEELIDRLAARADAQAQRLETLINRAAIAEQRLAEALRAEAARPAPTPVPARPPERTAVPTPEPKPAPREPARAIAADSPHADVYALADDGLAPAEIARRLGAPKGEIELILSLRHLA